MVRSSLRTVFYAILVGLLLTWRQHGSASVSGLVIGLLFGDFVTWLGRTILTALTDFGYGAWQATVNIVAGVVIYQFCGLSVPRGADELGMCFIAFLTVVALKAAYYSFEWVKDEDSD